MKNHLFTLFLLLIVGVAYSQTDSIAKKTTGPVITFKTDSVNIGTVAYGTQSEAIFEFTNTGDEPLIIIGRTTSCGCLGSNFPKSPISPGETGKIVATYDTKRVGKSTHRVLLKSNAVNAPTKELFFTIHVLDPSESNGPIITFERDFIDAGTMKNGDECKLKYEFTNTGNEPLIIAEAKSSCGCVVAYWSKEPIMPGKKNIITVYYDTKWTGRSEKSVMVYSNAINTPVKRISFKIEVLPPNATEGDSQK